MKIKYFAAGAFLIFSGIAVCGCGGNQTTSEQAATDTIKKDTVVQVNILLKDNAQQKIYLSYIALKDALVKSDAAAAKIAATQLSADLKKGKMQETALQIAQSDDLKIQRKAFTSLNNELIAMFKNADLAEGKIYVQHCPMANNGDGGDWLASEKNIRNPYYGDEMMECGAVVDEIKVK